MKMSLMFWIADYAQKRGSGFCLENATMIQIQDMFEKGKPDIDLKTVKGFNLKRSSFLFFILEKDPKPQSFNLCPFLTLSVRNGPSVSFGINVHCV